MVETQDLRKSFPAGRERIKAVDGVDLAVRRGEIFGFLGPNGAGKTTTLRMLTTLLRPDSGTALVAGFDVTSRPGEVRRRIGYVGQTGGSDREALGRENLVLQGRLYRMTIDEAKRRAAELIEVLQLGESADRMVSTYSGGQRRRLDVALGIVHHPEVLFLDEPTTGLDPQNRANLWDQIQRLRERGTTVFLTTHYLEEADALADRLAIIDHGVIVAEGTPRELKRQVAGDVVTIGIEHPEANIAKVRGSLADADFVRDVAEEQGRLRLTVDDGEKALPQIMRLLNREGVTITSITLAVPTLDDVFLRKTGRSLRDVGPQAGGGQ